MSAYNPNEVTRNEKVIVTNSSSSIMSPRWDDKGRTSFVIRNTSSVVGEEITIAIGENSAVAQEGILLKQGETYAENTDSGFVCWQGRITAICNNASAIQNLSIFER